jgi:endonuclease/exonuclease/phosphatase (EEP) superfamily protein YafD
MTTGTVISSIVVFLYAVLTFLPLVRNDFWTFRILEYPRLQKLVLGLVLLLSLFFVRASLENNFITLAGVLVVCLFYLVVKIFPYTIVARKEMLLLTSRNDDQQLKIFTANVLQTNREYHKMLQQISQTNPDIILLVETDEGWSIAMEALEQDYPESLKCPLNNTYGLLFYSRLPVRNEKVIFRVDEDIPSVEAEVQLASGVWVKMFGLHPKPPVPGESMRSTAKDKELMKVAFEVEKLKEPCVVMGDLNDVAWSYVTELFRKVSGLLDPRRGRGFYSTFSANHKWLRFPLDYIFCSSHFGLISMKRMPHNGSDHFAMFIHLQYEPRLRDIQDEPEADASEREAAAERASQPVEEE